MTFLCKELPVGGCDYYTCIKIFSGINFLNFKINYNYFFNALTNLAC